MDDFFDILLCAFNSNNVIKITLSKTRNKSDDLRNVYIRPVLLKGRIKYSFLFRYTKRDEVKNYDVFETIDKIKQNLSNSFYNIVLNTTEQDVCLMISKKGKSHFYIKQVTEQRTLNLEHDHVKKRFVNINNPWWIDLGVVSQSGAIVSKMQHKYKQICKYIEILDNIFKKVNFTDKITIADMGAGRGYLTFALYEYISLYKKIDADIQGIEIRKDLVSEINHIISKNNIGNYHFIETSIEAYAPQRLDFVVALHACDTATDDAIIKGIKYNAKIILCAPCCHKQIRKEMEVSGVTNAITRFGLFMERQAVMITDVIRALVLEYFGYKTQIIEFIETEHTPKNALIIAIKDSNQANNKMRNESLKKINDLKSEYGIKEHYLEKILPKE